MEWETTARPASLMGTLKVEPPSTPNHRCIHTETESRFR